uniref:Uncharacterized protein n=1 Tax=Candidatus Kentrum sp. LPFa TaxID=2126335 RepID=A0A450Y602_9GAMM|nr:MAG: hypothetical protein BECKLPF1236C_GA0070990_107301 [Candidatus Kentron sp. LPFa]
MVTAHSDLFVTDFPTFPESAVTIAESVVTFLGIFSNTLSALEFSQTKAFFPVFGRNSCQQEEFRCEKSKRFYVSSMNRN